MTARGSTNREELLRIRLANQALTDRRFVQPDEVVGWFGAMQAQEFAVAKWSIGQRMQFARESAVSDAIDDGRILRTHVLRPTWHFIARQDIRWILTATAHRVHQLNAGMYRQLDLDEELLAASLGIIERTLSDGKHRTRDELGAALAESGIQGIGMRLGYIVHHAELEALICSGAVRGKQQTYALVDERAPDATRVSSDEALAKLVLRYFTSHGPASVKDCAGWASLTLADVRRGIAMAGEELRSVEIEGLAYWFADTGRVAPSPAHPHALLVQAYDEYIMGYFETRSQMAGRDLFDRIGQNPLLHIILIDGQLAGRWKRTIKRTGIVIEVKVDRLLTESEWTAVEAASQELGAFCDLPMVLVRR